MDASAGIAMGNRRGLGRAKHVDAQYSVPLGTRAYSKERVSSQERRRGPNVGRRAKRKLSPKRKMTTLQ